MGRYRQYLTGRTSARLFAMAHSWYGTGSFDTAGIFCLVAAQVAVTTAAAVVSTN